MAAILFRSRCVNTLTLSDAFCKHRGVWSWKKFDSAKSHDSHDQPASKSYYTRSSQILILFMPVNSCDARDANITHKIFSATTRSILLPFHQLPRPRFNIKMSSYRYRKSHCGDKTVVRSSYLHNGISFTGKMTSLYWISPQKAIQNYINSSHNPRYMSDSCRAPQLL